MAQCNQWIRHGRQMYSCHACKAVLCPGCSGRAGRKRAPPRPSEPTVPEDAPQTEAREAPPTACATEPVEPSGGPSLLTLLRQFPTVRKVPLIQWIPEQAAQRYAAVRIAAVEWFVDAAEARVHPDSLEMLSRLAHAVPHLLLRRLDKMEQAGSNSEHATQLGLLRRRLSLAEQARWVELVEDALGQEQRASDRAAGSGDTPMRDAHADTEAQRTLEQATGAADEGDFRKAKRLLMGMRLLPPTEDTFTKIGQLFPPAEAAERAFAPLPPTSAAAHLARRPVHEKHVIDFVRACRRQAHPGPAGERNAHIATAMRCPRAALVLTRWANLWASMPLPLVARAPWLHMLGIGGDKGGGKARPIVFQEALFKLAAGTISRAEDRKVSTRVGCAQYAAGDRPGTTRMIWETEAEMAALPLDIYFGLDIENAFGTTRRREAHLEALECSTPTAQLQWNMWYGEAEQRVWVQVGNEWRSMLMQEGVCQGGCSAKQDFTLAFARAQRTVDDMVNVALDGAAAGTCGSTWNKRLYMDDECMRIGRAGWKVGLEATRAALALHGYKLRLDKTKAHCPAARVQPELASALSRELEGFAEFHVDGLPLLGRVADGEHSTIVSASGPLPGPVEARMAAARQLAASLHRVLDADVPGRKRGPVWKLTSLVLNKALSYDVCVSPPGRLRPHADELDALVAGLARRCADPGQVDAEQDWERALTQLRLPRTHGGLDLQAASSIAPFAYLSTVVSVVPGAVTNVSRALGGADAAEQAIAQLSAAGLLQEAARAQQLMAEAGVTVDAWGMPAAPGTPAGGLLDVGQAARAGIDLHHRRRAWLVRRADQYLASLTPEARAHHWTHGGDEGGLGFTANVAQDLSPWDDCEFVTNMRRRIRLPLVSRGDLCQHARRATRKQRSLGSEPGQRPAAPEGLCGAPLDEYADHAVQCMIGGDHTALHDAACDELAAMHQQAGLRARREVYVPQLATQCKTEPRADIAAWGTVVLPVVRLDFTVVSPWAARNAEPAKLQPAEAARRAENAKATEYGARAGISLKGVAMEAGGRHGPQLAEHMRLLASLARRRDGLAGREPRRHLRCWQQRLAVLLGRFTAQAVTTALGGCTLTFGGVGAAPQAVRLRAGPQHSTSTAASHAGRAFAPNPFF